MFNLSLGYKSLIWPALIMGFLLSGCSSTSELFLEDPIHETGNTDYSVIYYIHADYDYLYHDADGQPVRGNKKVLEDALRVAEEAKSGEVFIYYQRPEKKFLGLFPRRSSRLYHYKNGEETTRVTYRHADKYEEFLTKEARLYHEYRNQSQGESQKTYFFYFGHEIPEDEGKKYHRTLPDIAVNTESFSAGIQEFLVTDDQRFNLVALSTCNNGTPAMADHLTPFSDVLLASPQNLHLSHIDSKSLGLLESDPGISSIQLADSMANQTYRRLESETETAITLAVYDFDTIGEFKSELRAISTAHHAMDIMRYISDNVDCREVPLFDSDRFSEGVKTWYRPARFGRQSGSTTHSGWGCRPGAS